MKRTVFDLTLREREIRRNLNEIMQVDEPDAEQRERQDALTREYDTLSRDLDAAQIAERKANEEAQAEARAHPDAKAREFAELRAQVTVSEYVSAALEQRSAEGANAEFNKELGMKGNKFPLELLAPPEVRSTTDVDTTVSPRTWLDRLFADTAAERLGITMESVAPGVTSYPVTLTGPSAAQRSRGEAAPDSSWTIGVTEIKPKRNTVKLTFSTEDEARIPGLEAALTRDMQMAVREGIDRAIFTGDTGSSGNSADITGLTAVAGITEKTITQTNKVKPAETLAAFSSLVDGIHASGFGDLRVVSSVGAWRLWEDTIANSAAENQTLAAYMRAAGLNWSSRGQIETATGNGKFGALVGLARGLEGAAACPVWSSAELIRDIYTGAGNGEVILNLSYLWNFEVIRKSNFARIKFVT